MPKIMMRPFVGNHLKVTTRREEFPHASRAAFGKAGMCENEDINKSCMMHEIFALLSQMTAATPHHNDGFMASAR
jgi:hypothetical protein